jgi:hypothetical protein
MCLFYCPVPPLLIRCKETIPRTAQLRQWVCGYGKRARSKAGPWCPLDGGDAWSGDGRRAGAGLGQIGRGGRDGLDRLQLGQQVGHDEAADKEDERAEKAPSVGQAVHGHAAGEHRDADRPGPQALVGGLPHARGDHGDAGREQDRARDLGELAHPFDRQDREAEGAEDQAEDDGVLAEGLEALRHARGGDEAAHADQDGGDHEEVTDGLHGGVGQLVRFGRPDHEHEGNRGDARDHGEKTIHD